MFRVNQGRKRKPKAKPISTRFLRSKGDSGKWVHKTSSPKRSEKERAFKDPIKRIPVYTRPGDPEGGGPRKIRK